MGRVRRYKKYKSCDPSSKKFGKEDNTTHDEPPEMFEQRARKSNRIREDRWDDEEKREHILQREALRELRMNQHKKDNQKEKILEARRSDESMKAFKARIKQETRKTLVEEVHKMTATAQKRKLRLKERSLKRKSKKGVRVDDEKEQVDFFMAENGHLRPSDLGESRSSFITTEDIAFGERAERPPDLNQFTSKFRVTGSNNHNATHGIPHNGEVGSGVDGGDNDDVDDDEQEAQVEEEEEEEEEDEVPMTKNMRNKKRKARSIAQRHDMDGDDGLENMGAVGGVGAASDEILLRRALQKVAKNNASTGKSSSSSTPGPSKKQKQSHSAGAPVSAVVGVKSQNEMEALRMKVQEAYRLMKEKRKKQF